MRAAESRFGRATTSYGYNAYAGHEHEIRTRDFVNGYSTVLSDGINPMAGRTAAIVKAQTQAATAVAPVTQPAAATTQQPAIPAVVSNNGTPAARSCEKFMVDCKTGNPRVVDLNGLVEYLAAKGLYTGQDGVDRLNKLRSGICISGVDVKPMPTIQLDHNKPSYVALPNTGGSNQQGRTKIQAVT